MKNQCHIRGAGHRPGFLSITRWYVGLCLALFLSASGAFAQTSLISTGAVWKFLDDGTDQGTAWRALNFFDDAWPSGPAQLGFGDGDEATTNRSGFITYYYRRTFNIPSVSSITNLRARVKRDDGVVVYLNNVEIFRDNMPTGSVDSTTLALVAAPDDGSSFLTFPLASSMLQAGNNIMAVEIHQAGLTSSDISFDFELLANPQPQIAIVSPTNGQALVGSSFQVSGQATPGSSMVTLVELFSGTTKVGESTNGNFSIAWGGVTPGNYSLSARMVDSSGLRATSAPVNVVVQELPASILIPLGAVWKYLDNGSDQGTAWRQPAYDDSAWASGPAELGYGDGGEATLVSFGPNSAAKYATTYFRKKFNVSNPAAYQSLTIETIYDDGAIIYINGIEVHRVRIDPAAIINFDTYVGSGADYQPDIVTGISASALVAGENTIAVEMHQSDAGSSDMSFNLRLEGDVDVTPPAVANIDPPAGSIQTDLTFITITFDAAVRGVDAFDLLINGEPATNVAVLNPREFTFYFPQPATGLVQVAWASTHGITDTAPLANPFAGGSFSYRLDPNASTRPNVIISEFLSDNGSGIRDEDGNRSDWIELLNLGPLEASLSGWYLTDTRTNLTKWRIPALVLQANRYLLVWASEKDRTNAAGQLHTNFKLDKGGEYLALVDPRTNIISEFSPTYPAQQTDISYGRDRINSALTGFFTTPTPNAANSTSGSGFVNQPTVTPATGVYTNDSITVTVGAVAGATVRYTVDGSNPSETSPLYAGPLTISTNVTIKVRAFPSSGALFPSAIASRNYLFTDNSTRTFTSKVPLLVISTRRAIATSVAPGQPRTRGTFGVFDTRNGRASVLGTPDYLGDAEFEHFGQTSLGFPKQPLNIELHDEAGTDISVPLLGFPADADWKLRNPYSDKPLLMDFLAFELFEKMGNYSVRRKLVEVFVDTNGGKLSYPGDYYGVLLFVEKIEQGNDRVDIAKLTPFHTAEPEISGGYMFKKDKDSGGDLNFSTAGANGFPGQNLKIHEPKPREITTNQLAWLRGYLNKMEQALYAPNWLTATGTNHYSYYLDPDAFVEQFWIVEFPKQIDGYRLSDYFQKDRGGRVKPEPIWDWNLSFGNANYLDGGHTNNWYWNQTGSADHPWAKRLITGVTGNVGIGDPEFNQKIADRWGVLRTNVMNGPRLLARIDELATMLNEAAVRDFAKFPRLGTYIWPNPDGAFGGGTSRPWDVDYQNPRTYPEIIAQMKKWVLGRYLWVEDQFTAPPALSRIGGSISNGTTVTITAAPGSTIYYTLDGTDPRAVGGNPAGTAQVYSGPITLNGNSRLVARAKENGKFQNTWSGPSASSFYSTVPGLRITEIMYHPVALAGSTNNADDFEFVEVRNTSTTSINLLNYSLSGGIQFTFTNNTLAGGQIGVVVKNRDAFIARYGGAANILGTYTGNLANSGDHIVLKGGLQEPILDFSYSDNWYPATDGQGFSLVIVNDGAAGNTWGMASSWRPSSAAGGSPGVADPAAPARPLVVINEALSHGLGSAPDVIELHNTTANPVAIGGWFLTDDRATPRKYVIPATTIPAYGYVTFNESQFNVGASGFALGARGDEVYLYSGNGTDLTGYAHGFDFGASARGATFGRHVLSTGEEHFPAQSQATLGATNAGPLVGPIVISEIQYHPADVVVIGTAYNNVDDEFIELMNISGASAPLFDTAFPTNTYQLRDAVRFDFPPNVTLPPGGALLVVAFDPVADPAMAAAFRARNFVPAGTPLYGPMQGALDNDNGKVELRKPETSEITNGVSVPYVLIERVSYRDSSPWPAGADGLGLSLQRINTGIYGNDPANWAAVAPTPGTPYVGGTPPTITSQPGSQLALVGSSLTLNVAATGTAPLRYQWRFNGLNIQDATNTTFVLNNIQTDQSGTYSIFVYNSGGSAVSTNFTVTARVGLAITAQPEERIARVGQTTNFTVSAVGSGSLRYQWRFNGSDIPGATSSSYIVSNIQGTNEGTYSVVVRDDFETRVSEVARLTIVALPTITVQPTHVTVVEGRNVSLSVAAVGTTPINFRWRRNGQTVTSGIIIATPTNSILTLTNVPLSEDGNIYTVAITNIAGPANLSRGAQIRVLADADRDGLPDVWEQGRAGFDPNNAADATADADGDGMTNLEEYIAGTDYLDPNSKLKADRPSFSAGLVTLTFPAVSNITYSVQYSDNLLSNSWRKLVDVLGTGTNRTEVVRDPVGTTNRFYRIVTPAQP